MRSAVWHKTSLSLRPHFPPYANSPTSSRVRSKIRIDGLPAAGDFFGAARKPVISSSMPPALFPFRLRQRICAQWPTLVNWGCHEDERADEERGISGCLRQLITRFLLAPNSCLRLLQMLQFGTPESENRSKQLTWKSKFTARRAV